MCRGRPEISAADDSKAVEETIKNCGMDLFSKALWVVKDISVSRLRHDFGIKRTIRVLIGIDIPGGGRVR